MADEKPIEFTISHDVPERGLRIVVTVDAEAMLERGWVPAESLAEQRRQREEAEFQRDAMRTELAAAESRATKAEARAGEAETALRFILDTTNDVNINADKANGIVMGAARRALDALPAPPAVKEPDYLRPVVLWFACEMEKKLRENDHKGGWVNDSKGELLERLVEETGELAKAEGIRVFGEAADVANFALMIADNARTEPFGPTREPHPRGSDGEREEKDPVEPIGRMVPRYDDVNADVVRGMGGVAAVPEATDAEVLAKAKLTVESIESLLAERDTLAQSIEAMLRKAAETQLQLSALTAERDTLTQKLTEAVSGNGNALLARLDAAEKERDALTRKLDDVTKDRDAILIRLHEHHTEAKEARNEYDYSRKLLYRQAVAAEKERDTVLSEMKGEREAAVSALESAGHAKEALRGLADALGCDAEPLAVVHAAIEMRGKLDVAVAALGGGVGASGASDATRCLGRNVEASPARILAGEPGKYSNGCAVADV